MTPQERLFVRHMGQTGDKDYAAQKAGYRHVAQASHNLLQNPAIRSEIAAEASRTLFEDLLPLALAAHKTLLTDKAVPAGARVQAIKLTYDRTLGALEGSDSDKEPSEMTAEELRRSLAKLSAELDGRPLRAKDITPVATPDPIEDDSPGMGVFD